MALTPIKGTLINLDDVFVATEDNVRYVTDRFSLWRLDELAGRSKLHAALAAVQDGAYSLTSGGAVKKHPTVSQVPQMARLVPDRNDGDVLERLSIILDYKRDGLRLWVAEDGGVVALDSRWLLDGYQIRRHVSGDGAKPVSVLNRADEMAGILMPVRSADAIDTIRTIAARITDEGNPA